MPLPTFYAPRRLLIAALGLGMIACAAKADLVWSPDTGYRIEGGVLSGLTGADGPLALDLMNQGRKAELNHKWHAALKDYSKVAKKYPSSIYAPEAYYRTGNIRWMRKQYYKAFDAFQTILGRYPNTRRFNELIDDEYRIGAAMLNGARNHMWGVIPTFTNRERGVQDMEQLLADAPYSDYAPLALMNVARGHQYLGDTDEAIDALDRMVNTYPDSVLSPDAYLRLATLHASLVQGPYYDQGETNQSITYDEDFMILFPGDPKIAQAATGLDRMKKMLAQSKIEIGDFFFYKRDNYPAARVFYNEAITSYPDSAIAVVAKKRLAAVEAKANAAAGQTPAKKRHFLFFF